MFYNGQQYTILVGLDIKLSRQHTSDFIEALFGALTPSLLDLHAECQTKQKRAKILRKGNVVAPQHRYNILAHAAGVLKACSPSCGSRAEFRFSSRRRHRRR
jgi:hypothetical protein